jgi:hypothetical protein
MSGSLYRALIEAKVPEDMAQKAAEEMADYDTKFADIRADMACIRADIADFRLNIETRFNSIDIRFVKLEGEMLLIKWMLGVMIAGIAALILKSFF